MRRIPREISMPQEKMETVAARRLATLKRALQNHKATLPPRSQRLLQTENKHQEFLLEVCRKRGL
jgi:hypothetical protein